MNNFIKFILIIPLVFLFTNANSQSLNLKDVEGTILLANGESLEGYFDIKKDRKIKFRKTLQDQKIPIDRELVDELIGYNFSLFIRKYKKGSRYKVKVVHRIIEGEVELFIIKKNRSSSSGPVQASFSDETHYYIGTEKGNIVTYLKLANTYSNKFSKVAEEYFGDCPELIDKIKNRGFERNDIIGIVSFYNNKCSKN